MAAGWSGMWAFAAPGSLPRVMAKTAAKAMKEARTMQPSTTPAIRRRLRGAVWGAKTGLNWASGGSTTGAGAGWAPGGVEDRSGGGDWHTGGLGDWLDLNSRSRGEQ